MREWIWLIPLLPFLGALLNGVVVRHRVGKPGVVGIACGSVLLSFLVAVGAILDNVGHGASTVFEKVVFLWIPAGSLVYNATGRSLSAG